MLLTIDPTGKRGAVTCSPSWGLSAMEACKNAPGRTRFMNGTLYYEQTEDNRRFFEQTLKRVLPSAVKVQVIEPNAELERALITGRPPFRTAHPPDPGQQEALDRAAKNPFQFAFFEKPGFGKTKVVLDHAVRLWCEGLVDGLLVLSLNLVHEQWVLDEIPKHVHESIPTSCAIHSQGKKIPREFFAPDPTKFRVLSANHSALFSKGGSAHILSFLTSGRMAVVVDESHVIKTPSANITRELWSMRKDFAARMITTGEPTPLGAQDYYAQMRFLDPSILGCRNYLAFKNMFCILGGFDGRQVVGSQNADELHRRMAPFVHVGEPVIEGSKIYEEAMFELPASARERYEELKEELLTEFDGQVVEARSVLAAFTKLHQVCCGSVLTAEGEVVEVHKDRVELLHSQLARFPSDKAIIWSRFRGDVDAQLKALGDRARCIVGGMSNAEKREIIKSFLSPSSDVQYLCATPGAAGAGLNLQGGCRFNVYYSNSDNAQHRWQSEMRTYRRGTKGDVLYVDILARRTVEVQIRRRLVQKRNWSDMSYAEFRMLLGAD